MNKIAKIFVGVDVSKDSLDIYFSRINNHFQVKNTDRGLKEFVKELSLHEGIECIAFESTGGYEAKMARTLEKAGYQTWLIDPSRIKAFIRSEGIKAKTDTIDARMIALFASQKQRSYIPKPLSENHSELRALVKRKEALTDMISMEKKRLKHPLQTSFTQESIADMIMLMEKQKSLVEQKISAVIASNSIWKEKAAIIQSIPGVGETTATALISHMPELGEIDHKKIAALIGLAPYTRESGSYRGKASIYGGRFSPRLPLYMAALTGARCNPVLEEFYQRLINNGKLPKVALIATMRKLICIINAMLRDQTYWKKEGNILPVLG